MPELTDPVLAPQYLCESSALLECGDALAFDVVEFTRSVPAFALRYDYKPVAYLNRCAHVPSEMDWQPGKFWDMDKRFIICAVHGALYDPPNGLCVSGPCAGAHLLAIPLVEKDGKVYWYPSERFQPLA
jgi:nitrite reductase/ring-hydroxylating ferredoxin subunit